MAPIVRRASRGSDPAPSERERKRLIGPDGASRRHRQIVDSTLGGADVVPSTIRSSEAWLGTVERMLPVDLPPYLERVRVSGVDTPFGRLTPSTMSEQALEHPFWLMDLLRVRSELDAPRARHIATDAALRNHTAAHPVLHFIASHYRGRGWGALEHYRSERVELEDATQAAADEVEAEMDHYRSNLAFYHRHHGHEFDRMFETLDERGLNEIVEEAMFRYGGSARAAAIDHNYEWSLARENQQLVRGVAALRDATIQHQLRRELLLEPELAEAIIRDPFVALTVHEIVALGDRLMRAEESVFFRGGRSGDDYVADRAAGVERGSYDVRMMSVDTPVQSWIDDLERDRPTDLDGIVVRSRLFTSTMRRERPDLAAAMQTPPPPPLYLDESGGGDSTVQSIFRRANEFRERAGRPPMAIPPREHPRALRTPPRPAQPRGSWGDVAAALRLDRLDQFAGVLDDRELRLGGSDEAMLDDAVTTDPADLPPFGGGPTGFDRDLGRHDGPDPNFRGF